MAENSTILIGVRSEPTGNAPVGKAYIWVDSNGVVWTKDDAGNLKSGSGITIHNDLTGKNDADQHIISAITGLQTELDSKVAKSGDIITGDLIFNSESTELGRIGEATSRKHLELLGESGLDFNSPAMYISSAENFAGYFLVVGENGLVTFIKPASSPQTQTDNNSGPINISNGVPTDLGVSIITTDTFTDPSFEWALNFENTSISQDADVDLQATIDGVLTGTPINYFVKRNSTALLSGTVPFSGDVVVGKNIQLRITSNKDGNVSNITIKLSVATSSVTAEWGQITGILSDQTDLQLALDNKADISTVNIFGTYAGNSERKDTVTNSSTTPVVYISNTVTNAPAGRYRVGATVGWALNTSGRNIIISWKVNGVIFGEMEVEPKDSGGDIKHINSGFDYIDHTGGDILLEMEFSPENNGDVATLFSAALEQWRVS